MKKIISTFLILFYLSACSVQATQAPTPTETETPTITLTPTVAETLTPTAVIVNGVTYWGGGRFSGDSVIETGSEIGLTYEAHNELVKCGLDDSADVELTRSNLDARINYQSPGDFFLNDGLIIPFDHAAFAIQSKLYGLAYHGSNSDFVFEIYKIENDKPVRLGNITISMIASGIYKILCK